MNHDFWSSFNNQAGLAFNKAFAAGVNYENRFGLKELAIRSAALIIPAGQSSLGLIYSNYGYTDFKKHFGGIACGLRLSEKITGGIQVDYITERTIDDYQNNSFVTCEAGIQIQSTDNTSLGIHIFNPVPNSLRKYYMPTEIRIGASYYISPVVMGAVEIEKGVGSNLVFKTGFEYTPVNKLLLRGGFSSKTGTLSFGIGYRAKLFSTDIAFITHERLGLTPSISIIIMP